ncbi:MAG: MBL fold metallo-hydrolase [Desulfuromonadales bacterium]|nr:MBL fold metallo-hydrolase [Desulfuromonadales bacterium]NIR33164.1 MBL fold metallo-hydrolase [Desulfuromonadales bacterium]NIS43250.1 MBL fold metallo-hydrolase [Desulfuromonadales bacterium]
MKRLTALLAVFLLAPAVATAQSGYRLEKLAEGVHAALAVGERASSNALIVEGRDYKVVAGAHLGREAIADLTAAAATVSSKPLRYFILTHHHRGFGGFDFDFPPGVEVLTSAATWKALDEEVREITFPVLFFGQGLTLKLGNRSVVLTNIGRAHTAGDVAVYLPEAGVLFASDLVYKGIVGYMGEGFMQDWIVALEFLDSIDFDVLVPGYGAVGKRADLIAFKDFFRAFLTEVIRHIEKGDSLEQTRQSFSLPAYEDLPGYQRFLGANLERAYRQLEETLARQ